MTTIETDYLIIGCGAVGLAFADTLLAESDADITIVDRHGKPGGHWNDAYSFVRLHQPSASYGVASMALGSNRIDTTGTNRGFYELATGHEVSGYFDRVMQERLLPSGRVRYLPMHEHRGEGRCVSLLSGTGTHITARRRIVDATWYGTSVPSTHKPKFEVAAGARLVPPNALPDLGREPDRLPRHFAVLGAGKTAMDAVQWLLESGAPPEAIHWVVPRDSWLLNRAQMQPGIEFFEASVGGQASVMEAFAQATSLDDLFERLEACGQMMRIDRTRKPSMFHYATLSLAEVEVLRRVTQVVRLGHVRRIEPGAMDLDHGRVALPPDTLFVDCTASAVERRPLQPIFQDGRIVLQILRMPQPVFSAALVAWVETHVDGDAQRNALCPPVQFPDRLEAYPAAAMANVLNQAKWNQDKVLRQWMANCRLDWTGDVMSRVDPADAVKMAILARYKAATRAAVANAARLVA
jgi:hypothetical protein